MTRIALQFFTLLLSLLVCALPVANAANDSSIKVKWSYKGNDGPERWAQLDDSFALCAVGRSQSPIDIPKKTSNADYLLKTSYHDSPMEIVDDGTSMLTIGTVQTIINDGHTIQLNFHADKYVEAAQFDTEGYQLVQFHFHSPSENLWHGRNFPLEIHFVHQGQHGKVLALGVFVIAGDANPAIEKIIKHIPVEHGKEIIIPGEKINPAELLPIKKDYYSFSGSLTTPPCTEGFQWVVMAEPITASPAQILKLRKAIGGVNARPVMPLNHRVVNYAVEKTS